MTVKTDWLDVTYAPNDTPEHAVLMSVQAAGAECLSDDGGSGSRWGLNGGSLKIDYRQRFARFSASGAFLDGLRAAHCFHDYLSALSESPHAVTRLDAAHDVPKDSPPILKALIKRYPQQCAFTRKALKTKRILETRADGKESGTFYVGHRQKGAITARVYDKQLERLNNAGEETPPLTRYELTFRKAIGPTLRDAAEPERIFWQHAGPLLLKRPQGVPEWVSGWGGGWNYKPEEKPIGAILKSRIESSSDLAAIAALVSKAAQDGDDCLDWTLRQLERVFTARVEGSGMLASSGGNSEQGASEAVQVAEAG